MQQEINLFKRFEVPRAPGALLTWEQFWIINLAFAIFLTFIYLYSLWSLEQLKSQKIALQKQETEVEKKFYAAKVTFPAIFFSQNNDVSESIKKLQEDFKAQEEILTTIRHQTNFSEELLALSQSISSNVWLTHITLLQNGKEVSLKGKSLEMVSLQKFLANLSNHTLFSQFSISLKDVVNPEANDDKNIVFEISLVKKPK